MTDDARRAVGVLDREIAQQRLALEELEALREVMPTLSPASQDAIVQLLLRSRRNV